MKHYLLNTLFAIMAISAFSLTSSAQTKALWVGETYMCDATSAVMGLTSDVSWSTNGGYISLSGSGFYRNVTATKYWSGTATVTCTWKYRLYSGDSWKTQSRSWTFTCIENPISIYPQSMNLNVGETGQISYSHQYSNSYTYAANVSFSSSNSNVATVSNSGLVTAKGQGTAYINVYSNLSSATNAPYCIVTVSGAGDEGSNIAINATNFPDANFRNWLLNQSYGVDGILTDGEINSITEIKVTDKSISTLQGIEYFTALTTLYCGGNQLTSLDVSKNTALTSLICFSNQLTSLDVSKNTALTRLDCYYNQLTSLDVSKNTALTRLACDGNQLTSVDVSKNTALTVLSCSNTQLTSLDVSKNTALTWLECPDGQLTSLNASGCTALTTLSCNNNQLTSLDVSGCTALKSLMCYSNQLTSLDVSGCTALATLSCSKNQLTSLDVSGRTALGRLHCPGNQLTSLDVSGCTALKSLICYSNQLKGMAMDAFIESLPETTAGNLYVYSENPDDNEGNIITKSQVAVAKAKGWTPRYDDEREGKEYEGSDDEPAGIDDVKAGCNTDAPIYTISGQKVANTKKGIYIVNGHKVVIK